MIFGRPLFYALAVTIMVIVITIVICMGFLIFVIFLLLLPEKMLNTQYRNVLRRMSTDRGMRSSFLPVIKSLWPSRTKGSAFLAATDWLSRGCSRSKTGTSESQDLQEYIEISRAIEIFVEKGRIPFNGHLGIVLITASFIMALISK
jgi:hypothetical protein